MLSPRQKRETNESDALLEVFNDNLSDILSESEDADDGFDDSGGDSTASTDSEIIRPIKKCKVKVISNDPNSDEATDNCWFETDTPPHLQMLKVMLGSLHFITNLFFGDELLEMLCKELSNYHDQTSMKCKTLSGFTEGHPEIPWPNYSDGSNK